MTLLQFHPPADNQRGPAFLEGLLASWVSLCGKQGMKLGIASEQGRIVFLLDIPADRQDSIGRWLQQASPVTETALRNFELKSDLFEWRTHHAGTVQ